MWVILTFLFFFAYIFESLPEMVDMVGVLVDRGWWLFVAAWLQLVKPFGWCCCWFYQHYKFHSCF